MAYAQAGSVPPQERTANLMTYPRTSADQGMSTNQQGQASLNRPRAPRLFLLPCPVDLPALLELPLPTALALLRAAEMAELASQAILAALGVQEGARLAATSCVRGGAYAWQLLRAKSWPCWRRWRLRGCAKSGLKRRWRWARGSARVHRKAARRGTDRLAASWHDLEQLRFKVRACLLLP